MTGISDSKPREIGVSISKNVLLTSCMLILIERFL